MRKLRQLSMSVMLALVLATCAFADAGIIGTSPEAPPEPQSATAPGTIETPPSAESAGAPTDPVVDLALNLLQSVLLAF